MGGIAVQNEAQQGNMPIMGENGVHFCRDDESTYPPEFTFVVTNLQDQPVYFDRQDGTWWTAKADKFGGEIYARNDFIHFEDDMELYWQPIVFRNADVLFIPAGAQS